MSSVARPAQKYSSTLYKKKHFFFRKKLLNTKCAFLFSLQLLSETFLILSSERDMIKNVMLVIMGSTRYSSQILMKLEFSRQIFETYTNIKLYEKPSTRSRVVLCRRDDGRTEGHDETNSRFSQFYESADKFLYSIKFSTLPNIKRKATQNIHTVQHELYSPLITCTKGFISEELRLERGSIRRANCSHERSPTWLIVPYSTEVNILQS